MTRILWLAFYEKHKIHYTIRNDSELKFHNQSDNYRIIMEF